MDNTANKIRSFSEWEDGTIKECCESKENPFDKSFHRALNAAVSVFVLSVVVWTVVVFCTCCLDLWRVLTGAVITIVVNLCCLFVVRRLAKQKAAFDEKIFDFDQKLKDSVYHRYLDYRQKQLAEESGSTEK